MSATTDDLAADVRRLTNLPDAGPLDITELLAFADAELTTVLAALIKTARQEHWMTPTDVQCDDSRTIFPIPRRALDRAFRQVTLMSTTGIEQPTWEVAPGEPRQRSQFHYYVQKNTLIFYGAPSAQFRLRIRARTRPSKLVPIASCAPIDHALTTTTIAIQSTPAALTGARYVDIVNGDSPHDLGYTELLTTGVAAGVVTLNAATPIVVSDFVNLSTIANDRVDYVCLRDQTCYPPLPEAAIPVLAAATARRVLEALGDPRVAVAEATYQTRLAAALSLISPQNEEGGRAIINRNSSLRSGDGGWSRRMRW